MGSEKVKPSSANGDSSRFNQAAKSSPKQRGLMKCGFTSRCSNASVSTLIASSLSLILKLDLTQGCQSSQLTLPASLLQFSVTFGVDLGLFRPAPDEINHLVPDIVRYPDLGQSFPRLFLNAVCSAI